MLYGDSIFFEEIQYIVNGGVNSRIAFYHAKHFKDYNLLQMEMGHRSSSLLRTRYLNMKGISPQTATRFWALTPAKVIEETKPPEEPLVS